jgi:hypothetical protein
VKKWYPHSGHHIHNTYIYILYIYTYIYILVYYIIYVLSLIPSAPCRIYLCSPCWHLQHGPPAVHLQKHRGRRIQRHVVSHRHATQLGPSAGSIGAKKKTPWLWKTEISPSKMVIWWSWTFKSTRKTDRLELWTQIFKICVQSSLQSMRKSCKHARLANLDQTFKNQVIQEYLDII